MKTKTNVEVQISSVFEITQKLQQSNGLKDLCRKFASVLYEFNCKTFSFLEYSVLENKLEEKYLGSREFSSVSKHIIKEFKLYVASNKLSYEAMFSNVQLGNDLYNTILLNDDDNDDDKKYFVLWNVDSTKKVNYKLIDFVYHQFNNENRWRNKLKNTQNLLYKDDLTEVFNQRYFSIVLDQEVKRSLRFKSKFTLLFIDLDDFKPVNDTYGHMAGSLVLKQVAQLLQTCIREIDIPIRFGGDEFVVILLGAGSKESKNVANRICSTIANYDFDTGEAGATTRVTATIGLASFPEHAKNHKELLKLSDKCMYDGKKSGKNRVVMYNENKSRSALRILRDIKEG